MWRETLGVLVMTGCGIVGMIAFSVSLSFVGLFPIRDLRFAVPYWVIGTVALVVGSLVARALDRMAPREHD